METYNPSRRQDLLVGSLVSTLLISTVFWLGNGPHYIHVSRTPRAAPVLEFSLPRPPELDMTVDIDDIAKSKALPSVDPVLPQLQDLPRVAPPNVITQAVEPPHPENTLRNISVIRNTGGSGSGGKVWEYGSLDRPPYIKFQARPHYPTSMIQTGMTGEVVVDFIVDTNGDVRNATAVRSTNREFESSAIDAVSKWKFGAGSKGGHAVFTHMQVPIEFSLNGQ
jgi:periplasmic protein TonB